MLTGAVIFRGHYQTRSVGQQASAETLRGSMSDHQNHDGNAKDGLCTSCKDTIQQSIDLPLVSPFTHLLHPSVQTPSVATGSTPHSRARYSKPPLASKAQAQAIRDVISNAESKVALLDDMEENLHRIMQQIEEERRRVRDFADAHRVLVAPVWELPPEILGEVFTFVACGPGGDVGADEILRLDSPSYNGRLGSSDSPSPPSQASLPRSTIKKSLLLSAVNQHWRRVALGTPQLWTTLIIDSKSIPSTLALGSSSTPFNFPELCLGRSGTSLPLIISVSCMGVNTNILNFITPLSHRWKRIVLDVPVTMLRLLSSLEGRVPHLRSVELQGVSWVDRGPADADDSSPEGTAPPNPLLAFSRAPSLESVTVSCVYQDTFKVLPFAQMKVWDSPVKLHDLGEVLRLAPKLEEAFIQPARPSLGDHIGIGGNIPGRVDLCPLEVHSSLVHLHIATGQYTNFALQLHLLPSLPNLRRLFLYLDKRVLLTQSHVHFLPFFEKNGSGIEELTLGVTVAPPVIVRVLELCRNVKTLQLHRLMGNEVVDAIALCPEQSSNPTGIVAADGNGIIGAVGTDAEAQTDGAATSSSNPSYQREVLLPNLQHLRLSGKIYFAARSVTRLIKARAAFLDPSFPTATSNSSTPSDPTTPTPSSAPTIPLLPTPQHSLPSDPFYSYSDPSSSSSSSPIGIQEASTQFPPSTSTSDAEQEDGQGHEHAPRQSTTSPHSTRYGQQESQSAIPSSSKDGTSCTSGQETTSLPQAPHTLLSLQILPPRHDKFDPVQKKELMELYASARTLKKEKQRPDFYLCIRPLDRVRFLEHWRMGGVGSR